MSDAFLKKNIIAGIIAIMFTTHANAQSFVVSDVKVNGLERLSSAVIFENLGLNLGKPINSANFSQMVRTLYSTGLFEDVSLSRQGGVLIVNVKERPSISEIVFTGNKDIKTKRFNEILRGINFYPGQVFEASKLDEIIKNLYQSYENRGKYSVQIDARTIELPRNRVKVEFIVSEGRSAIIKELNMTGNESFSERKLKKQIETGTSNLTSFFSQNDRFSQEKLNTDLDKIKDFYKNRGYMKFEVNSSNTALTPDGREMYVDIDLNEGARYKVTGFDISGDTIVPKEVLMKLIVAKKGKPYNQKRMEASINAIQSRIGDEGYAFAKVNAIPEIDEENKTVSFIFAIDPGERAYVRRINITGNERTQDEVFRREMRQMEGSWFVSRDVERSRTRIQRLPYVTDVEAIPVQISNDQVDIEYKVKERSAGSVTLGVSYGQDTKFGFNAGFQQPNFMGTGKDFGINVETNDSGKSAGINFTDPYFTDAGLSAGISLNYNETNTKDGASGAYIADSLMLGLNFGYPISEYSNIFFDIGVDALKLKSTYDSPAEIVLDLGHECIVDEVNIGFCFEPTLAKKNKTLIRMGLSWVRDTRDRTVFASEGNMTSLGITGTAPGSSDLFYKLSAKHSFFYPLWEEDVVFSLRGELGYGDGYGKTKGLPFYERFYSGGLRSVRGYETSSLGPQYVNGQTAGGAIKVNATAELIMTVPGLTENRNIRWSIFADAGQVYCKNGSGLGINKANEALGIKNNTYQLSGGCAQSGFNASDLRYSAGLSFAWISPMGPLVFSYAKPMNKKKYDRNESFQFSIGIPF